MNSEHMTDTWAADELGFRPDVSHEHLRKLVEQIRAEGLPDALWLILRPWTAEPRRWHPEVYGIDVPEAETGPWVCELNAPVRWHSLIGGLESVEWVNSRPTADDLGRAWDKLEAAGLRPSVCVNLGPAGHPGRWLVQVLSVSALGKIDDHTMSEVGETLGGRLGYWSMNPEWILWRTDN